MCHVATLRIGSAEFHGVNGCTANLSDMESALDHELGGVLGMGVFANCQMTLDYPAGELLLEPPSDAIEADSAVDANVLPLKLSETGTPFVPSRFRGLPRGQWWTQAMTRHSLCRTLSWGD